MAQHTRSISMNKAIIFFLLGMLITGCSIPSPKLNSDSDEAHASLVSFFELLNAKEYNKAASIYGGSYDGLQDINPSVDPADHAKLLENACEINGNKCYLVRSATFMEAQGDTFIFQVEFNNPDGSLFVRGPCCGANETEMPPESQFEYKVKKTTNGKFLVMDLPIYVP